MNAPAPAMTPDPAARFRVLVKWASGGMADVYVARQQGPGGFDKLVALKLLREDVADDEEFRAMFFDEVRTAALLNHPNIVQTFDAGETAGRLYMAMEFVDGEPLSRLSRTMIRRGDGFPVELAVSITSQVADALSYAHTLNNLEGVPLHLVHRDVSPANVLVSEQGRVKLVDFGIAKVATKLQSTRSGVIKGKYRYMAPEQARGDGVDARTDVYSLGIILWELLTHKKAFTGDTETEILREVLNTQLPPPSEAGADCGGDLDEIVMRALARDPDARYEKAADFSKELSVHLARTAPAYDAPQVLQAAIAEHFGHRRERLRAALQNAEGIDIGTEDVTRRSLPSASLHSPSVSDASIERLASLDPSGASEGSDASGDRAASAPRKRRRLVAAGIALAVVGAGLGGWAALSGEAGSRPLTLASVPPGAEVRMGDRVLGETPLETEIPADRTVELRIAREDFEPWTKTIDPGEQAVDLTAELEAATSMATLIVESTPTGAAIVLDGERRKERTPAVLTGLRPDRPHSLVLTAEGHGPVVRDVRLSEGESKTVELELEPTARGFVAAKCAPEPCEVVVEGEVVGTTPFDRHAIAAGRPVEVTLRQDGEEVVSEQLELAAGQRRELVHEGSERAGAERASEQPRRRARRPRARPAQAATGAQDAPKGDDSGGQQSGTGETGEQGAEAATPTLDKNPYLRGR